MRANYNKIEIMKENVTDLVPGNKHYHGLLHLFKKIDVMANVRGEVLIIVGIIFYILTILTI